MRAIVLHKFGSPDALISDEEAPADRLITEPRFRHRSGVLARRILSLVMALTLACALSSGVNASDGGNGSKSSADSPDSAGLEESYIEIEKTKLHVVQGGTGQQTVVMIHGNAGDVHDFEYGVAELLSKSYRVIGFDRPGHGKSARPGSDAASVEDQARMLHEALQNLGVNNAILLGYSWGASLALCYALKYPAEIAGLVLLAPAAFPDTDPNPLLRAVVKTPLIGGLSLMFAKTLMGDQDQVVSPKENAYMLKEAIPQAQIVELKGAGHQIPLTRPGSVYSALKLISTVATDVASNVAL